MQSHLNNICNRLSQDAMLTLASVKTCFYLRVPYRLWQFKYFIDVYTNGLQVPFGLTFVD